MATLYIWILLFCLGLVLYFAPVFLFDRRYEGFIDAVALGATIGTPEEDPTKYIKQLQSLLQPQTIGTPDFAFSPTSVTAPPTQSAGTVKTPEPVATSSSVPALPNPTPDKTSPAIEQGANFQQTKPNPSAVTVHDKAPVLSTVSPLSMALSKDTHAAHPPLHAPIQEPIIKYVTAIPPTPKCPPAPKCPDMRDYIRKDSIPCWGCKLK